MKYSVLFLLAILLSASAVMAAYQGTELLGDRDNLRQTNLPYDLLKQNSIGINYMENLLDCRSNITSYSHLTYLSNFGDAWHLQFPDDAARFLEGLALEADYSPVVRLELARRIAKGIVDTHVHGTTGLYGFRLRYGGKSSILLDTAKDGWVSMCYWGDYMEPGLDIGFEAVKGKTVFPIDSFQWQDHPTHNGSMEWSRSAEHWNESHYEWKREYYSQAGSIRANLVSGLSDEYMPLEINMYTKSFDKLVTLFGRGKGGMHVFNNSAGPARVYLPDRKTVYASDTDGDVVIEKPDFNYIILTKTPGWANRGYSDAVIILWDGKADKLELLAEDGYGQIRLTNSPGRKSRITYTKWFDPDEMGYLFRNCDYCLKNGTFLPYDCPMPENNNADYTGLAAAAYMMTKWNDPYADVLITHAERAVDQIMKGFPEKHFIRAFFPVRACAWMILTAKEMNNAEIEAKYTRYLETALDMMFTYGYHPETGGWGGTWDHWNSVRALFMAYKATGRQDYYDKWQKALSEVTIDSDGMYVAGVKKTAAGDINTYFGAMPIGAWGAAGWRQMCEDYMHMNAPAYDTDDSVAVSGLWNDAGAGPWAQDDANPEFVGYCLAGIDLPYKDKYIIPVGSFASYDDKGNLKLRNEPLVDNPWFRAGNDRYKLLRDGKPDHVPSYSIEPEKIGKGLYAINAAKAVNGLSLEADITGEAYGISASPDGKKWFLLYDTANTGQYKTGVDLSAFVGNKDKYLQTDRFYGDSTEYLVSSSKSYSENRYRFVGSKGELVYRIPVMGLVSAFAEVIAGNTYVIELSSDGENWERAADANYYGGGTENVSGGWLRKLDLDKYLGKNYVYLRITNLDKSEFINKLVKYPGTAFIERCTLYGIYDTDKLMLRVKDMEGRSEIRSISVKYW